MKVIISDQENVNRILVPPLYWVCYLLLTCLMFLHIRLNSYRDSKVSILKGFTDKNI